MAATPAECVGCGRDLRAVPLDETISKVITDRGAVWLCAACYEHVADTIPSDT
jgi:hypothetical protein